MQTNLSPEHPIIIIWNNRIQNGRRIAEKVHFEARNRLHSIYQYSKGHVTRSNFSCNLQRNKGCVASCKKKFTCNTPFCNCNCCVASCKKSKTTLYFSQRCETSCLRVTSFCQFGSIRAHLSQDVGDLARPPSCLLLYALQVAKKVANVWHPLCILKGFLFVIVALQVASKIASCNMALTRLRGFQDKIANLLTFFFLLIPKRALDTKKTSPKLI